MSYNSGVPTGVIIPFGGTSVPFGYLSCDGSAVSRTTYAKLFAVIGTAHGNGDGSTTFNVPDYRGRFLRGVAGGSGADPDRATRTAMKTGGNTGDNVGSVQGHAFYTHGHSANAHKHYQFNAALGSGGLTSGTYCADRTSGGTYVPFDETTFRAIANEATVGLNGPVTATNQNASATGSTSQATANETRPVNAYVNYIIKT